MSELFRDYSLLARLFQQKIPFFVYLIFILASTREFSSASSCCGGNVSAPGIISGDERRKFTLTWTLARPRTDVTAGNRWVDREDTEDIQTYRAEAAFIVSDRWQTGLAIPISARDRAGVEQKKSTGLGDVAANLAYEVLPEWEYSPWKPKGFLFTQLILPTGQSSFDTLTPQDIHGRGFSSLGVGFLALKSRDDWSVFSSLEIHRSWAKAEYKLAALPTPGWGGSFSLGGGWSLGSVSFNTSLTWMYEDPVLVTNGSVASLERSTTGSVGATYGLPNDMTLILVYSDQTLFGAPLNTTLNRAVTFGLQRTWSR